MHAKVARHPQCHGSNRATMAAQCDSGLTSKTVAAPFKRVQLIKEYSWIFGRRGRLARKRFTAEQIVIKLREAEVAQSQGKTVVQVCKPVGVTEQTDYRWRKEYGGLRMDQAKRLKSLDKENGRLKKLVADLSLDNQILKEVSSGNFQAPAKRRGSVVWVRERFGPERVCERRACRVLGQARSTQRRVRQIPQGRGTTGDPDAGVGQSV